MNLLEESPHYSLSGTVTDWYVLLSEPSEAPPDTGDAWPAISAMASSSMIVMLKISFRYWATCFFTVGLRNGVQLS